ncbi:McrC family protein [Halalkalicoccus sp. NIPERK01]|uniref:McrC family protein n=1 Tax=Halalkalicoccus sp. NIPERK01 TaxID=3053469 RepID=UPI00256ECB22|nr:restriction endonuclease [Halalkalicoccus sp. NIPERK01]MDL5363791.1 restriction endonuclease [Halalkalicoccus sp. NIPERK01]
MLELEVNREATRLEVQYQSDGTAVLRATQHVGVVSLPDGPMIEIRPKAPGTDLLAMLRYAHGVEATTIDEATSLTAGQTFIEALASIYKAELNTVLRQGLQTDYQRVDRTVSYLRGRVNVQRQLQRHGPMPTTFDCTYDERTADTIVNRAVLYATTLLMRFVRDRSLSQALERHQHRLRRQVTLESVRPVDLEGIELTRLSAYYTDLLRLTKLVLRSVYVDELRSGRRASFALLVDMNRIFESVVERAMRTFVAERPGWTSHSQASSQKLVAGGKRSITIRPDVLIRDGEGRPVLVGDAKWKVDAGWSQVPSNEDIYQLVAYQVAHDAPGVLLYPEQEGRVGSQYSVRGLRSLTLVEVPTSYDRRRSESFEQVVVEAITSQLAVSEADNEK